MSKDPVGDSGYRGGLDNTRGNQPKMAYQKDGTAKGAKGTGKGESGKGGKGEGKGGGKK